MKSLNRTLSLVLVLVMVLGLFGVASAATFTDDATIQYKEAVNVMTGIGAINGMGDGTFAPTGSLTRAQAAKLVAYTVLGADVAKILPVKASSFKDVDATYAWAIPSIEYLVGKGVINGLGDGTFNPAGNVTGYQLAKMLLVALDVKGEYTGASWELNTAIAASKAGLFKNSKAASFSAAATREEAALYCFNALFYSATGSTSEKIYGIISWNNGQPTYGWIDVPVVATGSIAATVYPTLHSDATSTDAYGRPAISWIYKTKAISSTSTSAPVLTYTAAVAPSAIKLALANAGYTTTGAVDFYTNGIGVSYDATAVANYLTSTTPDGGNGCLVEVYVNPTTGVLNRIVAVNTYLATVVAYTKDSATTTTVDERSLTFSLNGHTVTADKTTAGFDAAYTAATTSMAAGTAAALLIVPTHDATANGVALRVDVPKTITGTITKITSAGVYTIGGTDYKLSAEAKLTSGQKTIGTTATYILDTYNNIIGATAAVTSSTVKYGYLLEYASVAYSPATLTTAAVAANELVKFVDSTGAVQTLQTAFVFNATTGNTTYVCTGASTVGWNSSSKNILFAYTLDANGKIASIAAVGSGATENLTITKGSALFDGKYMTDGTVVFYVDSSKNVAVYTGYNNIITKATTANSSIMNASPADSSYAALVVNVSAVAPTTAAKYAFFASAAVTTETVVTATGTSTTFTYTDVYLDGVKGTLTFTGSQNVSAGELYTYTETSGIATLSSKLTTTSTQISSIQSGYVVVGSDVVYTSSATKYYVVDLTSGAYTAAAATAIQPLGATYTVRAFYVAGGADASNPATAVYFYVAPVV